MYYILVFYYFYVSNTIDYNYNKLLIEVQNMYAKSTRDAGIIIQN